MQDNHFTTDVIMPPEWQYYVHLNVYVYFEFDRYSVPYQTDDLKT
jgi:hypothetical protein